MAFALNQDSRRALVEASGEFFKSSTQKHTHTQSLLEHDFFGQPLPDDVRDDDDERYVVLSTIYKNVLVLPHEPVLPDGNLMTLYRSILRLVHAQHMSKTKLERLREGVANTVDYLAPFLDMVTFYNDVQEVCDKYNLPPLLRAWHSATCRRFRKALPRLAKADMTSLFDAYDPERMEPIRRDALALAQAFRTCPRPFRFHKIRIPPVQDDVYNRPPHWNVPSPPEWEEYGHTMKQVWAQLVRTKALDAVLQTTFDVDKVIATYRKLYAKYPKDWDYSSSLLAMATYQVYTDVCIMLGLASTRCPEKAFFDKHKPETIIPQAWQWMPPPLVPRACAEAVAACRDLVLSTLQETVLPPAYIAQLAPIACFADDTHEAETFHRDFCASQQEE